MPFHPRPSFGTSEHERSILPGISWPPLALTNLKGTAKGQSSLESSDVDAATVGMYFLQAWRHSNLLCGAA